MTRILLFPLLFALCASSPAEAAAKKIHYKLYWRERGGEVVLSTVCDNYGYGSIAYRGCRAQAKHHFEEQCRVYRHKEEHSSGALRERYLGERRRFCHAASQFGAVN